MNIYVGNLAWKTKRKELKELFENFGVVSNAFIVRDKKTRRSRGFGFVEMVEDDEARMAIEKLNNTVFLERTIIVNEARAKEENFQDDDTYHNGDPSEGSSDDQPDSLGSSSSDADLPSDDKEGHPEAIPDDVTAAEHSSDKKEKLPDKSENPSGSSENRTDPPDDSTDSGIEEDNLRRN